MLKKAQVETRMQRDTQTDRKESLSIHEQGVQTRRHRWEDGKNTGAYIQVKPVKSRGINWYWHTWGWSNAVFWLSCLNRAVFKFDNTSISFLCRAKITNNPTTVLKSEVLWADLISSCQGVTVQCSQICLSPERAARSPRAEALRWVTTMKTPKPVVLCWWQQRWAQLALITVLMVVQRATAHRVAESHFRGIHYPV